jgi:hypothetical protein
MLKNTDFNIPRLEGDISVTAGYMYDYRVENADPVPVLYQSGYLTIKGYDREYDEYRLGFPNEEVKFGFLNGILEIYSYNTANANGFSVTQMVKALRKADAESVMLMLQAFYADIPSDLQEKKHKNEKYFQSLFYTVFSLMGQYVEAEMKSVSGHADAVVKTADAIYVFEFKMDEKATVKDALQQIDDKGYLIPYQCDGRNLVKIGAVFNREKGILTEWEAIRHCEKITKQV